MLSKLHIDQVNYLTRYKERGYNNPYIEKLLGNASGYHTVSFELHKVDASVANAIRRCVISETPKRVMTFDLQDVSTNSLFVLSHLEDIKNRFNLMQISQSIPLDTVMSYSAENNTECEYTSIYTDNLEGNKNYCDTTYKVGNLNSHEFLKIKRIYIVEGRGVENACYNGSIGFTYEPIDYISVDYALENVIANVIVKNTFGNTNSKRILINPDNREVPSGYDLVITERVPFFNTNMVDPQNYKLGFKFDNRTNGREYVMRAMMCIISRLQKAAETPFVSSEAGVTTFILPMESHTIGFLITRSVYELRPDIAYVCVHNKHLTEPDIEIRINDHDAVTLYKEAIKKRIELFERLVSSFTQI